VPRTFCRLACLCTLIALTGIAVGQGQIDTTAEKPIVRSYPCPVEWLDQVAERLRARFANRGVHVGTDSHTGQLLVVATPATQEMIRRELAALGVLAQNQHHIEVAHAEAARQDEFLPLVHSRVERVETMLRDLIGPRLRPLRPATASDAQYELVSPSGSSLRLLADRRQKGLQLSGTPSLVGEMTRLIRALDRAGQPTDPQVRVLPLHKANPTKVQQAVEAYRSGYRQGVSFRQNAPSSEYETDRSPVDPNAQGAVVPLYYHAPTSAGSFGQRPRYGHTQLAAFLLQIPEATDGEAPGGNVGGENADPADLQTSEARLRELGTDVEVEALPDLGVIILRGRDRDVAELARIIEEIERLSAETEPAIEIYPLRHVGGEALVALVDQVNQALLGGRQGRVSITPLVKPNALLLIGWGEAVEAAKELIAKLDRPVAPETQLRVFPLRHAPAMAMQTIVQGFFTGRTGLGPRVLVAADARTNSLIVQAAPRDVAEVALMVQHLDRPDSEAVSRVEVFPLKNSLAADTGGVLQAAIDAARGGSTEQKSAILELLTITPEGEQILSSGLLGDVEITPDVRANTLIVSAPAESMDLLATLIERLDAPSAVAQIKVFRVVNGDATAMVTMLQSLLPSTDGMPGPQLPGAEGESSLVPVRFSVDTRTNSIIATGSQGDLNIIEALLLRLDEEEDQQRVNAVYRLKNAPAIDVATAINEFLRSERLVQQATPGVVNPFQRIESEVVVVPEPVSNALIISATPRFFDEIQELVQKLDEEPPQVMIQVLIAEVALGDIDEFGVELGLQDSLLFDRSLLGNLITTVQTTQTSSQGDVTTSTNEIIQAADNMPGYAFIQIGKRVPRISGSGLTQRGQVNTIEMEPVGLILGVTPRISPEGMVVMEIDAEKSELDPVSDGIPVSIAEGTVIRSPSVNLTTAQTTVSASDGETIVLGGLITKSTKKISRRVPFLADIPVISHLFRYDNASELRTELLIILTPHVVRTPEDAERVKQVEAARMHWCLADVQELHGLTGLYGTDDSLLYRIPMIYPDEDPRGVIPRQPQPVEASPFLPDLIPPGEDAPADAAPSAAPFQEESSPPASTLRIVPSLEEATRMQPPPPAAVTPAGYVQPLPYHSSRLAPRDEAPYRRTGFSRRPISRSCISHSEMATINVCNHVMSFIHRQRTLIRCSLAVLLASPFSGCASWDLDPGSFWPISSDEPKVPDRMTEIWDYTVLRQPGQPPVRGFGGRIMFYAEEENKPVLVNGTLTVFAFDAANKDPAQAVPERKFVFLPEKLPSHYSKSKLGHSYSFWLPWDEVGGPPRQISLITRFEATTGESVMSEASRKTLPGLATAPPAGVATRLPPTGNSRALEDRVTQVSHEVPVPEGQSKVPMKTIAIDVPPNFARKMFSANDAEPSTTSPAGSALPVAEGDFSGRATAADERPLNSPAMPSPSTRFPPSRFPARTRPATRPRFAPVERQPLRAAWPSRPPAKPPEAWSDEDAATPATGESGPY